MRNLLILSAAAVLIAVGCQEEAADPTGQHGGSVFTAKTEGFAVDSKTAMDADRNILWSEGDQIAIFMDSPTASLFEVTHETAGTSQGKFTLVGTQNGKADSDRNVAVYPYQEALEYTSANSDFLIANLVVPETQNYAEGSFGNGAFFMAAFSQNQDLNFKNISGALKLQLIGDSTIKSIKLEGNNGEKLAGAATATVYSDGTAPTITMADNAATSVTIDCGEGVQLNAAGATSFIFALPPVSFSKGFTITVTDANGKTKTLSTSVENQIARSSILAMPARDIRNNIHLTFTESDEIIANPERGFYEARSTSGYPLSKSHIAAARTNKRTLFHIGHTLPATTDISSSFLQRLRNELSWLREGGAKCILRFSYSDSYEEKPWDATPEQVLKHIAQLKPILQEYGDVILTFQAGFVGIWGEWYYTDNFDKANGDDDYALRKQVVDAMLDAMPADRSVALRTPLFKKMMYAGGTYNNILTEETAYNGSALARLSCFNDCFGASNTDQGTFDGSSSREYWKNESKYVFMGGETCDVSDYCKCSQSLQDMEDYHWSYLNNDYNQDVIGRWETDGCIDEIKRRLGYRLSLTDVYHSATAVAGNSFSVKVSIKNSGFAAPMNGRAVELILVDSNGNKTVYDLSKNVDPRYWFAGGTYTFEKVLQLPAEAIGECTMYLNLPDPKSTLHDNPKFSIRLANSGIWNEDTGYNKMFDFTVLEKGSTPAPEPTPGDGNGTAEGEDATIGEEFNPWGEN